MKLIDTHAHLFDDKYSVSAKEIAQDFFDAGGLALFGMSSNIDESVKYLRLKKEVNNLYIAAGVHPHYANEYSVSDEDFIKNNINDIDVIGEIGLDYFYDFAPREKQVEVFERQMQLALELNKPVSLHCREAHGDFMEVLRKYQGVTGVVHCFSGSVEVARESVKLGYMLGIGGSYTFKNGKKLKEVVKEVGLDNIVLETDSPYLAPEPIRGSVNVPQNTLIVAKAISDELGVSLDEVLEKTTNNAIKIFKIGE